MTGRPVCGVQRCILFAEQGTKNGLMNIIMLGESDDSVVTEISSYGVNAAAMHGMPLP